MKRRLLLKLALFLTLGAIVNVAVAWAINLSAGSDSDIYSRSGAKNRPATADDLLWLASIGRKKKQDTECLAYSFEVCATGAFGFHQRTFHEHVELICPGRHMSYAGPLAGMTSAGWPFPSFSDEIRDMRVDGAFAVSGFEHAFGYSLDDESGRTVPYNPIVFGLMINTVFYAFVLWLLFAAPVALRRRRRIKRGLCPKCAYDLRGAADRAVCLECGNQLTAMGVRSGTP